MSPTDADGVPCFAGVQCAASVYTWNETDTVWWWQHGENPEHRLRSDDDGHPDVLEWLRRVHERHGIS